MIPLIIPNFNQLTYLKNLINWWQWYTTNPIYIIDNGSDYEPLIEYYSTAWKQVEIVRYQENNCVANLTDFLANHRFEYYVISDPDISPSFDTPPNFLNIFKDLIDQGYHHVGFDLITDDIPEWNEKREIIIGNEKLAGDTPFHANNGDIQVTGRKAAIDTTFAMYTSKNSGWHQPMNGQDWGNALRLFKAHHLMWYLHKDHINDEMQHYFNTCKKHIPGEISAGRNNYGI